MQLSCDISNEAVNQHKFKYTTEMFRKMNHMSIPQEIDIFYIN